MRLVPERHPIPRLLVFPFALLAVAGLHFAWRYPDVLRSMARCPLLDLTGVPCPTCGGTRVSIGLVQGMWHDAFAANPFVAAGLVLFGLWVVYGLAATLVPAWRRELVLGEGEKKAARISAWAVLLAAWVWQIVRLG